MLKHLSDLSRKTGQHSDFSSIFTFTPKFTRKADRLHHNHRRSGCFNTSRKKKNLTTFHSEGEHKRGYANRSCLQNNAVTAPLPKGVAPAVSRREASRITPLMEDTGIPGSCQRPPPAPYHSTPPSSCHLPL